MISAGGIIDFLLFLLVFVPFGAKNKSITFPTELFSSLLPLPLALPSSLEMRASTLFQRRISQTIAIWMRAIHKYTIENVHALMLEQTHTHTHELHERDGRISKIMDEHLASNVANISICIAIAVCAHSICA